MGDQEWESRQFPLQPTTYCLRSISAPLARLGRALRRDSVPRHGRPYCRCPPASQRCHRSSSRARSRRSRGREQRTTVDPDRARRIKRCSVHLCQTISMSAQTHQQYITSKTNGCATSSDICLVLASSLNHRFGDLKMQHFVKSLHSLNFRN